jgi:type IV pilus assembly protein PilW
MKPLAVMASSRRRGSRGVTLVELMVAVTIGLLIVVVLAQLFLGSRQTFATTDDISRMQDNIRYTQQLLTRTVHLAGYKSQANSVTTTVFSGAPPLETPNPIVTGSTPDAFTVRFQGSGSKTSGTGSACQAASSCPGADLTVVDCLGLAIDAGVIAINTFSIAPGANGRNALFCHNGSTAMPGVEIVPDVANMQILYGEDVNGDLVADRYVAPETTGAATANVVSVRIALLFETPTDSSKTIASSQTYDMLSDGSVVMGPYADRRIRRLVTTTINLRNRTP